MDFSGKHVVVTGGTGALGSAVVGGLLAAGAHCTVPYVHEAEAQRFPHSGDPNVKLIAVTDLADEAMVAKVYEGVTPWASIHLAGGFAPGKVADLVVLTKDPLADIRNTRAIQSVMLRGKLLDTDSVRAGWQQ